eukprot:521920-Pleurochrysis_carterae.AAC.1
MRLGASALRYCCSTDSLHLPPTARARHGQPSTPLVRIGFLASRRMAYTFMKIAFGMQIGKSLFDKNGAELVPKLMEKAKAKGCARQQLT